MKNCWKSVKIWQSYEFSGLLFLAHPKYQSNKGVADTDHVWLTEWWTNTQVPSFTSMCVHINIIWAYIHQIIYENYK